MGGRSPPIHPQFSLELRNSLRVYIELSENATLVYQALFKTKTRLHLFPAGKTGIPVSCEAVDDFSWLSTTAQVAFCQRSSMRQPAWTTVRSTLPERV